MTTKKLLGLSEEQRLLGLLDEDPFTMAASRQRLAVQPAGGRKEGRMSTVAGRVRDSAGHMLSDMAGLPQRALTAAGDLQRTGEYDAAPATETVMNLMGGASPFAVKGAAGIFGGRLAQTADKVALAKAEEMAAKGAHREDIWRDTGWFQGADKKWRFEIPDDKAQMSPHVYEKNAVFDPSVEGQLRHEELYKAYPDIRDGRMVVNKNDSNSGAYYAKHPLNPERIEINAPDVDSVKSLALHELQHGVQHREGFTPGSSVERAGQSLSENTGNPIIEELRAAIVRGEYGRPGDKPFMEAARNLLALERQSKAERAFDVYRRDAGEVEARNVQTRMDYSPGTRSVAPWWTEDVPEMQILLGAP